jgi:hypothetical protein
MTNPSTLGEDWLVDGTSLYTLAYNISTLAGREHLPPKLGDNIQIPYRNGRIWKPKYYDQQMITLGMWIRGADVNGNVPSTRTGSRAQFNSNLRALRRLFAPTGRQLALSRILQFTTGAETHTAQGEVASGSASSAGEMDLQPITPMLATFTVDIVMADPWWYGSNIVTVITSSGATVTHPGDVEASGVSVGSMTIALAGPLTNPRLTNTSISPNVWVQYTGTINSGTTITLDLAAFTAKDQLGNSLIGSVSHSGSLRWMLLEPGSNAMTLTNGASGSPGTGTATLTFAPPYT